jgi:hypothetical protein
MPSLRRRRLVLISVIVVTIGILVAGLLLTLEEEPGTVDATTSAAPPVEASDETPTGFKLAWARLLPERADDQQLAVDSGYVAVLERTGVRVYELPTGRERWHYLDTSRVATRVEARYGTLLMVTMPAGEDEHRVQVFDLDSGEVRSTVPLPGGKERAVAAFAESFLVLSDGEAADARIRDPYRMYGLNGKELWSHEAPPCDGTGEPSTQAYLADGGALALATHCSAQAPQVGTTHLVGVFLQEDDVAWRKDFEEVEPLDRPSPPTATWLVEEAPILLRSPVDAIVPVDVVTGAELTGAPLPPSAGEVTSVRDGWCLYLADSAGQPMVHCYDEATGTERGTAYPLPFANDESPTVRILPKDNEVLIASTTSVSLTLGAFDGRPVEVTQGINKPVGRYFGAGGLVVVSTLEGGDAELSVYSSAE